MSPERLRQLSPEQYAKIVEAARGEWHVAPHLIRISTRLEVDALCDEMRREFARHRQQGDTP